VRRTMRLSALASLGVLLSLAGCGDHRRDPAEAGKEYGESLKGKGTARECILRSFDTYEDPDSRWLFGEACQDAVER